jgi:hypothetical protein
MVTYFILEYIYEVFSWIIVRLNIFEFIQDLKFININISLLWGFVKKR